MDLDPPEWPPRKRAVSNEAGRRMAVNAAVNRAPRRPPSRVRTILAPRLWLPPNTGADPRICITLRDAMFVVEKERGMVGGGGAARGWT
ncbi:hypothetical protein B0H14DRAFT_2759475 [Mycena olivaceomarginata]|nr:hypothetical protein B0H14DRAFT_2759475 [Mycena olivaceomarginata]